MQASKSWTDNLMYLFRYCRVREGQRRLTGHWSCKGIYLPDQGLFLPDQQDSSCLSQICFRTLCPVTFGFVPDQTQNCRTCPMSGRASRTLLIRGEFYSVGPKLLSIYWAQLALGYQSGLVWGATPALDVIQKLASRRLSTCGPTK